MSSFIMVYKIAIFAFLKSFYIFTRFDNFISKYFDQNEI